MDINLKEMSASLSGQFEGLSGRHPGLWPLAPRLLCAVGVMAAVIGLGTSGGIAVGETDLGGGEDTR